MHVLHCCCFVPCLAQGTETAAGLGEFAPVHDRCDGERDSDQAEDLEDLIPLSEDFDEWPDAPVMLCADPAAAHQVTLGGWGVGDTDNETGCLAGPCSREAAMRSAQRRSAGWSSIS
jgi:hypothetical protein